MATDGPPDAQPRGWSVYATPLMAALAALGFSSGVPNLFASSIVRTWTTKEGWSVESVGALSLLTLPYALKFLWAPLVDRVPFPGMARLGRLRSWMLATHAAAIACMLAACVTGPGGEGAQAFIALAALAVLASATLDIAVSAFQAESLPPRALGAGAGMFVSGYRAAFAGLGLGILALAPAWGWPAAAGVGCSLAALGILATLAVREPPRQSPPEPGLRAAVVEPFRSFFRSWGARVAVLAAFVVLFRLPDQLGNAMVEPLLLRGLGYGLEDLAWIRQGLGFGLTIAGAVLGGWMVARLGVGACLWIFGILQATSNAGFMLLASAYGAAVGAEAAGPAPVGPLVAVIAVESVAGGMVSAGFVAYLMSICDRRSVATQYAVLTALMALGGAVAGSLSGLLLARLDYAPYFALTVASGLPGLALIPVLRRGGAVSPAGA